MPRSFPRAPLPFLSALLAPIAWLYGRPDLFDSYSAGVMLLQLSGLGSCFCIQAVDVSIRASCYQGKLEDR